MIIDIHVHALPRRGQDALGEITRQSRANGLSLALISIGGKISQYPDEAEVKSCNDLARDFAERADGYCQWLVYLNPENADWREELDRCLGLGAIGVKIWCSLKDANGGLGNAAEVIGEAGNRDLGVLIHTWQHSQGNMPGEITLPEFATLAEACPQTRMVGAHSGGNWRQVLGVLRGLAPNAHVDVSGFYPERGMVAALVADLGAERVLFGSDLAGRTQASQLAKVVLADIPEDQKELILWKNAARVFGIKDVPPAMSGPMRPIEAFPDGATEHFCFAGSWPIFDGPWVEPAQLDVLLAEEGIEKAYTGHFSTLYRQDLERANNAFLTSTRNTKRIAPLATVNPCAHNWQSVIRHLSEGFAGVILFPYVHNWRLDDPEHRGLFEVLAQRKLAVWINCALGDDRTRHSGLACRPVSSAEVASFCSSAPGGEYVFQGTSAGGIAEVLEQFKGDRRFRFEMSKLNDNGYAWDTVADTFGISQLVMGSEFPLRHLREVRWAARRI
jgi:hypothetical protein